MIIAWGKKVSSDIICHKTRKKEQKYKIPYVNHYNITYRQLLYRGWV
jgi:hypothetical protein